MTGYTALTNHTYVAAYQAEIRADLHSSGASRGKLEAINRLAERWLTRTGTLRATRGMVSADQTKSAPNQRRGLQGHDVHGASLCVDGERT
jgi:hypothetical protein